MVRLGGGKRLIFNGMRHENIFVVEPLFPSTMLFNHIFMFCSSSVWGFRWFDAMCVCVFVPRSSVKRDGNNSPYFSLPSFLFSSAPWLHSTGFRSFHSSSSIILLFVVCCLPVRLRVCGVGVCVCVHFVLPLCILFIYIFLRAGMLLLFASPDNKINLNKI